MKFFYKAMTVIGLFMNNMSGEVSAGPLNSCSLQSDCLDIDFGTCGPYGIREVCLYWKEDSPCNKDGTISHACPGDTRVKYLNAGGSEDWASDIGICQDIKGGEQAYFGIKDGPGCDGIGEFPMDSS